MRRSNLAQGRWWVAQNAFDQMRLVGIREGRLQRQHFVERQAQGVNVTLWQRLAVETLRGHIAHGAHEIAGVRQVLRSFGLGQSEISDPDAALAVDHQVGGLDVPMENALSMSVSQGVGHLDADAGHTTAVFRLRFAPRQSRSRRCRRGRRRRGWILRCRQRGRAEPLVG